MRRFTDDKLVIASHNSGKITEISRLLEPFAVEVIPAAHFDLVEPEETEETFAGNARIKAHFAAKATGLPALADDSGIQVDALGGAPGVHTADWANTDNGRDFVKAMTKVWTLLEERDAPLPRIARFCSTLCLAWPDGHEEIVAGSVEGEIVWPRRGDGGFGFDPVFLPQGEIETFAEMDPIRKQKLSHRARAFAKLVAGCFA